MAKIVLSPDAPENQPLAADFGVISFDAGRAKSFETDDAALIAEIIRHPFFDIEGADEGVTQKEAEAYLKRENSLQEAREEWAEHIATLRPWDPQPIEPRSLEDVENAETASASAATKSEPAKSADDGGSN